MKGMIIYKGKYGATRQYAIWLGTALELPIAQAGTEAVEQLADADYVIMGASVYMGKLQMKRWIKDNLTFLSTKKLYLFVVSGTPLDEVNRLQEYVKENVPEELRNRVECFFFPGKLEFSKLSLKDKLLLKIGTWLSSGSRKDKVPLTDYNKVNRLNIAGLVEVAAYQKVA
jgi:menaquinone-dependent protoporphyrinogen IX oxidase